jgi:NAD(P)-dependent dehydrogenase (short-subunit alcohol dehydrogenase family)
LTALSDSLRMELAPFGITVVTVQPGGIKSNLSGNADKELERFRKTPYGPIQNFIVARANASQENATPAAVFAKELIDKLERKKTPKFIRLGKDSTLLPFIARFPRVFIDALLSKRFGLDRLRKYNK